MSHTPITNFAECVRSLRDATRLTQAQFATECGVSERTIVRWEDPDAEGRAMSLSSRAVDALRRVIRAFSLEDTAAAHWLFEVSPSGSATVPRVTVRLPGTTSDVVFDVRTPEDLEFLTRALRSYL